VPRRYQDLQESLAVAPTLVCAAKRHGGERLVERKLYSEHPPRLEYTLRKRQTLGPVMKALRDWGQRNTECDSLVRLLRENECIA